MQKALRSEIGAKLSELVSFVASVAGTVQVNTPGKTVLQLNKSFISQAKKALRAKTSTFSKAKKAAVKNLKGYIGALG